MPDLGRPIGQSNGGISVGKEPEQAGVIAHRPGERGPEILLVTSRSSGRWIIPKGNIEPELTARESAAMEAYEEGGIKGHVRPSPIGVYQHGVDSTRPVIVFLMDVRRELADWPEKHERERQWVHPKAAMEAVAEDDLKKLISSAVKMLKKG